MSARYYIPGWREAWPLGRVDKPTPEQLCDNGRVDGIPAIRAKVFERMRMLALQAVATSAVLFDDVVIPTVSLSANAKAIIDCDSGKVYVTISAAAIEMAIDPGLICRSMRTGKPIRGRRFAYVVKMSA